MEIQLRFGIGARVIDSASKAEDPDIVLNRCGQWMQFCLYYTDSLGHGQKGK